MFTLSQVRRIYADAINAVDLLTLFYDVKIFCANSSLNHLLNNLSYISFFTRVSEFVILFIIFKRILYQNTTTFCALLLQLRAMSRAASGDLALYQDSLF